MSEAFLRSTVAADYTLLGVVRAADCDRGLVILASVPVELRVALSYGQQPPIEITVRRRAVLPLDARVEARVEARAVTGSADVTAVAEAAPRDTALSGLVWEVRRPLPAGVEDHVPPEWAEAVRLDTAAASMVDAQLDLLDPDGVVRAGVTAVRQPEWLPLGSTTVVRVTCGAPYRLVYRIAL